MPQLPKIARSADPKQQALRDKKRAWYTAKKEFAKRLSGLSRGLSGKGSPDYSVPPSDIKDPLPSELGAFMHTVVDNFGQLIQAMEDIIAQQAEYSATRRKPQEHLPPPKEASRLHVLEKFASAKSEHIGRLRIGEHEFDTELAITSEQQEKGLMYREDPSVMAFVYSTPKPAQFWMKDTPAPLDIIFTLRGSVINICRGEPYSTKIVGDYYTPSDLVIEMPAGSCKKLGITIGSPVSLQY